MTLSPDIMTLLYLAAGLLFILGIKGLASPATARKGNLFAMLGMGLAVIVTLLNPAITSYTWIVAGMAVGAVIGIPIALKISMTALPQLVALFHSFVGLAAVLVAGGMYWQEKVAGHLNALGAFEMFMGAWIGAITFSGSLIAFGKLQGIISGKPVVFKGQHLLNLLIFAAILGFGWHFMQTHSLGWLAFF